MALSLIIFIREAFQVLHTYVLRQFDLFMIDDIWVRDTDKSS